MSPWVVAIGAGLLLLGSTTGTGRGVDPPQDLPQPCRWFTWAEVTRSSTAAARRLDNRPHDAATYRTLSRTCKGILDPLVDVLPYRVVVTSGYRSPTVNRAVGGYEHSDHLTGQGLDITLYRNDGTPLSSAEAAMVIRNSGAPFDTLIWYGSDNHVHLSWAGTGSRRRVQYAASHGARPVDRLPMAA